MKKDFLCLIGCGWLGNPLANFLFKKNYPVTATATGKLPPESLTDGISYIDLDLNKNQALPPEIENASVLIYTIPPLELSVIKNFFEKVPADKKIIFTSSTSVYGKNIGDTSEETPLDLNNTSSALLVETENYLRQRFKNITILRLGGLYGKKRHPVHFLAGKKNLKSGEEFLHLAHLEDCIQAIDSVLTKNAWGEVFNIVSDLRVTKKEYYLGMAQKLSLPLPEYDITANLNSTRISNEKSKNVLGVNYLDPNRFCESSH